MSGAPEATQLSAAGSLDRQREEQGCLSRRDYMIVARHEMPGKDANKIRMIDGPRVYPPSKTTLTPVNGSHRTLRDGFPILRFQAFHARLLSYSPYGTNVAFP